MKTFSFFVTVIIKRVYYKLNWRK